VSVVGRAEKFQSLTLGLDGTNPRFPWKPSVTMLTYRLIGTTEHFGINHDEPDQCPPQQARPTSATSAQSSRTTVRLRDGATLLTCGHGLNGFRGLLHHGAEWVAIRQVTGALDRTSSGPGGRGCPANGFRTPIRTPMSPMFAHVRQCSLTARTAVDLREYTLSGYQRTHLSKLGVKWSLVQILSARHTKTGSELLRSAGSPIAKHDLGTILGPQLGRTGAGQRP
jgi:hypothetical protein